MNPIVHAAATGAIDHLAAQWYVPVFAGPIMVVAHIACIVTLLQTKRDWPGSVAAVGRTAGN